MSKFWEGAGGLVVRKLITLLFVLLLVLTIEFLFFRVGLGPDYYIPRTANYETVQEVRDELHLNDSLFVQYFYFISDMLTGHGSFDVYSYSSHRNVSDSVTDGLSRTLMLILPAFVLSLGLGLAASHLLWRIKNRYGKIISSSVLFILWILPVMFVLLFFLLQVVSRFSIDWAIGIGAYDPGADSFARFISDMKVRLFPILIITLCSVGGFALIGTRGIRRSNQLASEGIEGEATKKPSFSECMLSVMPDIKLNIAFLMSMVFVVEVFWMLPGLSYGTMRSVWNLDTPMVEAAVFAIVMIVLVLTFLTDVFFSLFALRSARLQTGSTIPQETTVLPTPVQVVRPVTEKWNPVAELRWFVSQYLRNLVGMIGATMLIAMALIALIGPMVSEPAHPILGQHPDAVSQFLIGSRESFVQTFAVIVLSFVIGFTAAIIVLPLGKFNYPVVVLAESLLVFPIVGTIMMYALTQWGNFSSTWTLVLSTVLVTWAPITLVVLTRAKALDASFRKNHPNASSSRRYEGMVVAGIRGALPDALSSLKFISVIGSLSIFAYVGLLSSPMNATWSGMISYSMQYMEIEKFSLWWILPLVGIAVLVSGFYLVIRTAQEILEKRHQMSETVQPVPSLVP